MGGLSNFYRIAIDAGSGDIDRTSNYAFRGNGASAIGNPAAS